MKRAAFPLFSFQHKVLMLKALLPFRRNRIRNQPVIRCRLEIIVRWVLYHGFEPDYFMKIFSKF